MPICAGAAGMLLGPAMVGHRMAGGGAVTDLDSHFRYLSGLLLGIGVAFASTIPRIEDQCARFRWLTFIVVVGGIGRSVSLLAIGPLSPEMMAALVMELVVTPCLAIWRERVARRVRESPAGNRH